jgi:hypothetical protein
MTETEIIIHMGRAGDFAGALAYDGPSGKYLLAGEGRMGYHIEVDWLMVSNLIEKNLIYLSQVIQGGSAELYDLTQEGIKYYEEIV